MFLDVNSDVSETVTLLTTATDLSRRTEDIEYGFFAAQYLALIVYKENKFYFLNVNMYCISVGFILQIYILHTYIGLMYILQKCSIIVIGSDIMNNTGCKCKKYNNNNKTTYVHPSSFRELHCSTNKPAG